MARPADTKQSDLVTIWAMFKQPFPTAYDPQKEWFVVEHVAQHRVESKLAHYNRLHADTYIFKVVDSVKSSTYATSIPGSFVDTA